MVVDYRSIKTIQQFLEVTPAITPGQLKSWIFEEKRYGLRAAGAVFKMGKKMYIVPDKFNEWLAAFIQAQQKAL